MNNEYDAFVLIRDEDDYNIYLTADGWTFEDVKEMADIYYPNEVYAANWYGGGLIFKAKMNDYGVLEEIK